MQNRFKIAGASVIGRDHLRIQKNNQDAYLWSLNDKRLVAIVCDGCGGSRASEVGASLGVKLLMASIEEVWTTDSPIEEDNKPSLTFWDKVLKSATKKIISIVQNLSGSLEENVLEFFLFTVVGVLITEKGAIFFSIGDGCYGINNDIEKLGPFENNAPPYLVYGDIFPTKSYPRDKFKFKLSEFIPIDRIETIFIGTDGVLDLVNCEGKEIPGKNDLVPNINQLAGEEGYFRPDILRRKLSQIGKDAWKFNPQTKESILEKGLLSDDTTLIIVKKLETKEVENA